jgi:hypothetical protein
MKNKHQKKYCPVCRELVSIIFKDKFGYCPYCQRNLFNFNSYINPSNKNERRNQTYNGKN